MGRKGQKKCANKGKAKAVAPKHRRQTRASTSLKRSQPKSQAQNTPVQKRKYSRLSLLSSSDEEEEEEEEDDLDEDEHQESSEDDYSDSEQGLNVLETEKPLMAR